MCQNVNAWHVSQASSRGATVQLLRSDGYVKAAGVKSDVLRAF